MSTVTSAGTDVDLSPERFGRGVPWEQFAQLRRSAPVVWYEQGGCWVVTRHGLVSQVNRDVQRFSSAGGIVRRGDPGRHGRRILVEMDPPEHTRYRALVNKAFAPRAVKELQESVRAIAAGVIGDFLAAGGGDLVSDLAVLLPFRVMADVVGVPWEDCEQVTAWANTTASNADPVYRPDEAAVVAARAEYTRYCHDVVREHRADPGDTVLDQLIAYRDDDGWRLSDEDLTQLVELLLTGGSETTRNLLSHTVLLLAEHTEQRRRLIDGEVDIRDAVAELLRYSSPVMQHSRTATEDLEIQDVEISAGDRLTLWMVSGNRDESVFDRPDELDLGRQRNRYLSFGSGGPHYCLGAHLTQLEATVFVEELGPRLADLQPAGPVERVWSNFFNGVRSAPVTVR